METDFSYAPICKFSLIRTGEITYYFDWGCLAGEVWDEDFPTPERSLHIDKVFVYL
jgi:hypothetical protein